MAARSWVQVDPESPFSLANIPFGIISTLDSPRKRPAIAIGDYALDMQQLASAGVFSNILSSGEDVNVFEASSLNAFAAAGRPFHRRIRTFIQELLRDDSPYPEALRDDTKLKEAALIPLAQVQNHVPLDIGDYTDFYVGLNHAYNVGVLFRGPENALQPNYKHLPVGYHGRSSSIVPSGQAIRRPCGQWLTAPGETQPQFGPSRKLDIELEVAAFVCTPNTQGDPVAIDDAEDHLFGLVLMNDWSARDIQAWEYVPLGPFNSKNFATTISPWVVLMDAVEPFRTDGLDTANQNNLLPYLREAKQKTAYDISLQVALKTASGDYAVVSNSNAKNLLFSFPQMLAHHTIGGCNMRTGDLLGSGTISGSSRDSLGSFLEITKNGKEPFESREGNKITRTFLQDGDEVVITGRCGSLGSYVGFGPCSGKVEAALLK